MDKMGLLKLLNLLAFSACIWWLSKSPGWEPVATALLAFAGLVALETTSKKSIASSPEPDLSLFNELLKTLPDSGSVRFIAQHDMGAAFKIEELDDLKDFYHEWRGATHEFLNKKLEKKKRELSDQIGKYLDSVLADVFPTDREGMYSVPREWQIKFPERYKATLGEMHKLADEVVRAHQDLVSSAKRILRA